jgi:hypothetical protein
MKKKSSKKEYDKKQTVHKVKEPATVYKTTKSEKPVLNTLLKKEKKKRLALKLKPMSIEELKERIRQSEEDIKAGRVYTHDEVKAHFKNKFKVR